VLEFALALPVLLLLACGLLDLGRAYYYGITVTDAARDGARNLIVNVNGYGPGPAAGCLAVEQAASNISAASTCPTTGTSPAGGHLLIGISCPDAGGCVGDPGGSAHGQPVTVDVYYGFQLLTPLVGAFVPNGVVRLHARAVMDATW